MVILPNRIERVDVKQYDIIGYDSDNLYPQRVAAIIAASGTATLACQWYAKFMAGQGFNDPLLSVQHVNDKGLTVGKLLSWVCSQYAKFSSFALLFNVNGLGQITDIHPISFDYVRIGAVPSTYEWNGKFSIYNNWDKRLKRIIEKKDIKVVYPWTSDMGKMLEYVQECGGFENFNGMIYYLWQDAIGEYPLAKIDPELESAVTDSEIKQNSYTDVTSGLISNTIVTYPGKFENEDERSQMEQSISDGLGARGARVKLIENPGGENRKLDVYNVAGDNQDKRFEYTEKSVRDRIRRLYQIPSQLLDAVPGQLGGGDIVESYEMYNQITLPERIMLEELFKMIAENWWRPMSKTGDFTIRELAAKSVK